MADKKIHLKIITPTAVKADRQADMVVLYTVNGPMGVMPGHDTRSVVLDLGILRIHDDHRESVIAVFGGIAEIRQDVLTVLTTEAEWPRDVDSSRAETEREHIERRLQESRDDMEIQRDQALLRRALVLIEVSSQPLIGKPSWSEDGS